MHSRSRVKRMHEAKRKGKLIIDQIFNKIPTKIILWKIEMKFTFKIFDEKVVIDFIKYLRNFI